MSSRGNYYDRPPRGRGAPPPSWEPYNEHCDNYGQPPPVPDRGPPHYNDYGGPPDGQHPDYRPPPRFYDDEPPYEEFHRKGTLQRPSFSPSGGRGRGQNGTGRGQSYSRGRGSSNSFNGPKQTTKDEKTTTKQSPSQPSKPAWLSQPTTTTSVTASSSTMPPKPSWLSQPVASTPNSTSSSSKPSWLSQSPVSTASSTSLSSKPAWLNQSAASPSNSNTTPSKPAWLSQSVNKAVTTTSNSLPKQPTWMSKPALSENNVKAIPSPKPAWVSKASTPLQQTTAKNVPFKANTLLPPPPPPSYPPPANQPKIHPTPPSYPPPANQPKIHPTQHQTPYTIPLKPQANQVMKPKKVKTKVQQGDIKVAGPSEGNFISFKNSLQEYCQKTGLAVPAYKSFKSNYGYSATVELSDGKKFHTQSIQKDRKEAEQFSAMETLKSIGLLPLNTTFINPPKPQLGAKRPKPTPTTVAKKLKVATNTIPINSPNYKCQLNEFCQKFHLPVPTYETINNGNGYVTTLVYNKKVYISNAPQASKRDAEQNVAQLALSKVNQAPPPSEPQQGPVVYPNFVVASNTPEVSTSSTTIATVQEDKPVQPQPTTTIIPLRSVQDLTAKNLTPSISYKNKLQEVCQKRKTLLPVYESTRDEKFYSCKVTIQGQVFNATGCKTKKGSEQSAARVALQALGLLNE